MKNLPKFEKWQRTFHIIFFMSVALILPSLMLVPYLPKLMNHAISVYDTIHDSSNVSNTSHLESPPEKPKDLRAPSDRSLKHFRSESYEYSAALRKMGFERAEDNEFKSEYIVTPLLYETNLLKKVPGIRKTKIISVHKAYVYNKWFATHKASKTDLRKCPYSECIVDLEGNRTEQADLVLFICKGLAHPPPRPPGQLWALGCWESSVHWNYPDYQFWKNVFNMTFHYRLDADIVVPNVQLAWRDKSLLLKEEDYLAFAKEKTKTAVWWVSNCRPDRLNFVRKMRKYIDIDITGQCGNIKSCPKSNDIQCKRRLNSTYKFYLSFENSFCKDYVTEKLGKIFEHHVHVVPVVKGYMEYEKHFPPGTYVNANKFKSAKDLALFLKELGNDTPRYAKMLQEIDKLVGLPRTNNLDWCKVCEQLHTRKFGVYEDIRNWSHANECKKTS